MKIDFSSMSKEEIKRYLKALGVRYGNSGEKPKGEGRETHSSLEKTIKIEKGEFSRKELSLLESLNGGNERARGAISTVLHESLGVSLKDVRVEDQVAVRVFPHRKYATLNPADVHRIIKMGIRPYLQEQEPPKTSLRHQQ